MTAAEPQLAEEAARRYPHKQAWMNTYLGILIFKLRPQLSARETSHSPRARRILKWQRPP